jgi:uncharacterized membrane protein YphA (DoxX/SURF4 family)
MDANAIDRSGVTTPSSDAPWMPWVGRVLSALPVLALVLSGIMKISHAPQVLENWTPKFGYPEETLTPVGVLELVCAILYLVPRTTTLGAILIAAYFGGAVATHVRIGVPIFVPLLMGVLAWAGLFFRDRRVRVLFGFAK